MPTPRRACLALTLLLAVGPAIAQSPAPSAAASAAPMPTPAPTWAEVKKIDLAQAKLTLKHEAIVHLDMMPMTMVFSVRDEADRALLPALKVGQRLRFVAERRDGAFVARALSPQP